MYLPCPDMWWNQGSDREIDSRRHMTRILPYFSGRSSSTWSVPWALPRLGLSTFHRETAAAPCPDVWWNQGGDRETDSRRHTIRILPYHLLACFFITIYLRKANSLYPLLLVLTYFILFYFILFSLQIALPMYY